MKIKLTLIAILASITVASCAPNTGIKQQAGTILGGVAGGVIGSKIGKGNGQVWATGAGAVLGALAGGEIGRQLDERDLLLQNQAMDKSYDAPLQKTVRWSNPETGHSGSVTPIREGVDENNLPCREYKQSITIDGKSETAVGMACKNADGTWAIQNN